MFFVFYHSKKIGEKKKTKGEAASGLKLGTLKKLDRSRAECKREWKGISSRVPSQFLITQ